VAVDPADVANETGNDVPTDLTAETELLEATEGELFANLAPRRSRTRSPSPHKASARVGDVARLGALVPSGPVTRSVPPPFSRRIGAAPSASPAIPAAPGFESAAPVVVPIAPAADKLASTDANALTPPSGSVAVHQSHPPRTARLAAALAVVTALVALAVLALAPRIVGGPGTLIVSVAGPGSSEVTGIEVLVDGAKRCVSSPCRIDSITAGTHLVKVHGNGYAETAVLAVTVEPRTESVLRVELLPSANGSSGVFAARAAQPPKQAESALLAEQAHDGRKTTTSADELFTTREPAVLERKTGNRVSSSPIGQHVRSVPGPLRTAAAESKPTVDEAAALGTLRIVSVPVVSVLVDARPVGFTPKVVRVAPGSHRVVFIGADARRVETVEVAAGESQVVSARF